MPNSAIAAERLAKLRLRAASRLSGLPGAQSPGASAADALRVLYDLSSSPDTAPDALALLHELQVHQVEVDLQAEEVRESRAGLESALRRQIELYDFQPVGCFTIDRGLVVHELNLTGARLLGMQREETHGLLLDSFLTLESGRVLRAMMASVTRGESSAAATLKLHPKIGSEREVHARIGADPAGPRFLVVFCSDTV